MTVKTPYAQLRGLLREKFEGSKDAFQKSIDLLIREMQINISDIEEDPPSYNGVTIKSAEEKLEKIQETIEPILKAGKNLINGTIKSQQGLTSRLELEQTDWSAYGGSTIDTIVAAQKLTKAINDWLEFAGEQPDFASTVKLPLPPGHRARINPSEGIAHLNDIYFDTMDDKVGYNYCTLATNAQYDAILGKQAGAAAPRPGQG